MNTELIARLEAAEVGSRELDWAIAKVMGDIPKHVPFDSGPPYWGWRLSMNDRHMLERPADYEGRSVERWVPHDVTTSLDAALALAARVLPDVQLNMATGVMGGLPWVQCYPFPQEEDNYLDAEAAATLPLALCVAILRALDAQEQK